MKPSRKRSPVGHFIIGSEPGPESVTTAACTLDASMVGSINTCTVNCALADAISPKAANGKSHATGVHDCDRGIFVKPPSRAFIRIDDSDSTNTPILLGVSLLETHILWRLFGGLRDGRR